MPEIVYRINDYSFSNVISTYQTWPKEEKNNSTTNQTMYGHGLRIQKISGIFHPKYAPIKLIQWQKQTAHNFTQNKCITISILLVLGAALSLDNQRTLAK